MSIWESLGWCNELKQRRSPGQEANLDVPRQGRENSAASTALRFHRKFPHSGLSWKAGAGKIIVDKEEWVLTENREI